MIERNGQGASLVHQAHTVNDLLHDGMVYQ